MGLADGEDNALAGQSPRGVLYALLHELPDDEGVGPGDGHLPLQFASFEIYLVDIKALFDQLFLYNRRELLALDPFKLELGPDLENLKVTEVGRVVPDSLFVGVREGRIVHFTFEKFECVKVDLVLGSGGEPDPDTVEIVQDLLVGIVDAPVTLVGNDEIEKMRRHPFAWSSSVLQEVEHRRVGGDIDPAVFGETPVTLLRPSRFRGQVLLEGVQRLVSQSDPVHKEQHPVHPPGPLQDIHQADSNPRLACSCRHDQEELVPLGLKPFHDRADCGYLVITAGYACVDEFNRQGFSCFASLLEPLKLRSCGEPVHFDRWIEIRFPEVGVVSVGVEDKGDGTSVDLFKVPGVLEGLFLALRGMLG